MKRCTECEIHSPMSRGSAVRGIEGKVAKGVWKGYGCALGSKLSQLENSISIPTADPSKVNEVQYSIPLLYAWTVSRQ